MRFANGQIQEGVWSNDKFIGWLHVHSGNTFDVYINRAKLLLYGWNKIFTMWKEKVDLTSTKNNYVLYT
jgi:hypothetical protein